MPCSRSNLTIGTILAIVLLVLAIFLRPALDQFRQRATIASIERTGCRCDWEWAPSRPGWVFGRFSDSRKHWGDWIVGATVRDYSYDSIHLQRLDLFKSLPYLRRLELSGWEYSQAHLTSGIVEGFALLEGLGIYGCGASESLTIRGCPKLKCVSISALRAS